MARPYQKQADPDLAIQLLDHAISSPSGAKPRKVGNNRSYATFRALGLHVLHARATRAEPVKIALRKDRTTALLSCAVHIVPLAGAMILLFLNFTWFSLTIGRDFPGDFDASSGLVGLQFAAKFHELTMVASLTTAFLSLSRAYLVSDHGVPLGAAFAGLQVTQLTYLWSPEIWALIHAKWFQWPRKLLLLFAIAVTAALAATVGPASAACMIPRANVWQLGTGILAINASMESLFPTTVSAAQYSQKSCDITGKNLIHSLTGSCTWAEDALGLASLSLLGLNLPEWQFPEIDALGTGNWTVYRGSSINTNFVSSLDASMTFSKNMTLSKENFLRYASTSVPAMGLLPFSFSTDAGIDIPDVFDAVSRVEIRSASTWWNLTQPQPSFSFSPEFPNVTAISADELSRIRTELRNISSSLLAYNTFSFVDLGDNATYGLALVSGNAELGSTQPLEGLWLTPLKIDLGWTPSTFQRRENTVSSTGTPNVDDPAFRRVQIASDWIQSINPSLINTNTTIYNYFINSIICARGQKNCSFVNTGPNTAAWLISGLLTATLSKMTPEPGQWTQYGIRPSTRQTGYLKTLEPDLSTYQSSWPIQLYGPGLGYGPDILAVRLSLAILILYSIIATTHILITVWTGVSSSAWDSVAEIVALCIHSRPAEELENTCAGIKATKVLEQRVRIAATRGWRDEAGTKDVPEGAEATNLAASHLELLFDSGEQAAVSAVKVNHEYGALKHRRGLNDL